MQTRILQLHKRSSYTFEHIQDKAAINKDLEIFALADGTTQSFKSEVWAHILTHQFVNNPVFEAHALLENFRAAAKDYNATNFVFSINPAKASLERTKRSKGGTATFIGLRFRSYNEIEMISCGDSNVFLVRNDKIEGIPFNSVDDLDANSQFINTEKLLRNELDASFLKTWRISLSKEHKIILATDALSRLLLERNEVLDELLKVRNFEELHAFCMKYWENKMLQEDDISAIVIDNIGSSGIHTSVIQPPKDFSFPKEEQAEFIPTSLQQPKPQDFSPMQMNDIKEQFDGVAHDFYLVKRKLKFHQFLSILTATLLILNLIAFYFFYVPAVSQEREMNSEPSQTPREIIPVINEQNSEPNNLSSEEVDLEPVNPGSADAIEHNKDSISDGAKEDRAPQVDNNQEILE